MLIPVHPTLRALTAVLLLHGSCGRGYHGLRGQWAQFTGCVSVNANAWLVTTSGGCGARGMYQTFSDMITANCSNCDNFFHCKAHYLAAKCGGQDSSRVAEVVSLCWIQSQRDEYGNRHGNEEAEEYGSNGGDCAERYLLREDCHYRPSSGECRPLI
ncbi:serum amyloid A-1 protein-like [Dermacentor silvarum]|uniref:serum amyloid A-1 protein-like n=1 Tax=Dermacentor silvarum TaxID=543639 RepID=UPI002101CEA4|nr:serum amyloid A-1 protein-like [Dermacentor silvarum]